MATEKMSRVRDSPEVSGELSIFHREAGTDGLTSRVTPK